MGRLQRRQRPLGWLAALAGVGLSVAAITQLPQSTASAAQLPLGSAAWSDDRLAEARRRGRPVFVYFTSDWCLTCKANEAAAIDRDATRKAFRKAGVKVLVGDWTNGDPAITRFLESRGRAGVPLYLWYAPGREPEELPQVLGPSMLTSRARRAP